MSKRSMTSALALACLFTAQTLRAQAPAIPTTNDPQASASRGTCFRPRPLVSCDSFLITDFGVLYTIGRDSDDSLPMFAWELGFMRNTSADRAKGGTLFVSLNDDEFRLGARARYRIWKANGNLIEIAPGIVLLHSNEDLDISATPGLSAQLAAGVGGGLLTLVTQADIVRQGPTLSVGARAGSVLGTILTGAATGLLALTIFGQS